MSSVIVEGNISGTGSVTIAAPNTNSDFTVTLPDNSGTLFTTGVTSGLNGSAITTGTVALEVGGTGQTTAQAAINALAGATTSGQYLRGNGTNVVMAAIQAGDVPTLNQNTTGSAATLTTARTIQTDLASTSSASFNGSANITPGVTGTLPVGNGGTGQTTYTNGQLLIGNTTGNTLTKATLTAGTGISITNGTGSISIASTNNGTVTSVAVSGGTTGLTTSGGPITTSGTITLAGTLAVANGGTGQTTYTNGQLLIGNTTGNTLTKATLTAGTGISITNGTGSITIAATGSAPTTTQVLDATAGASSGAVGTYAFLYTTSRATYNPGSTLAGSSLFFATTGTTVAQNGDTYLTSPSALGTWRIMGYIRPFNNTAATVCLRIS
jgi:hypothetical protein